ncbi:microtubule-associated serine/threonine-protein kinase 4-like [Dendrobates tinctorius]|uniref:microtubule-associated serine/threonine-protein kinase 4-like n=1 Tax=Dendrobates tinctorius TaxID=92724 RepID=UPI003CCA256A
MLIRGETFSGLWRAENRSQHGDLSLIKELAEEVLCVLEGPARSSDRLETPEGDTKDGQNVTTETPDPNTSQPGPSSDLTTGLISSNLLYFFIVLSLTILETTELVDPDSVILEIPEIQEPDDNLMESSIPARKPQMSDYETSKLISSGSFGAVCLVRHKDSQKIFAMKKMAKKNMKTPKDDLSPWTVTSPLSIHYRYYGKSLMCVMSLYVRTEHVSISSCGDCETLLTTRGPLSVPLARLYFAEAVVAVEYLHSYGVVHRDLKPENLLITPTGHIKVADFGLSTVGVMTPKTNTHKESVEDITREFQDREECGTPSYMAPEIILKKGYGRPADWWSMGIILHRLLLGYVPFHGDTLTELRDNIVGGDINWDWDCAPPPDAQDLISDLLRTNPAQRIGTGGAFEIKSHPFLSDIDFDNLLSQKPEYIPQLVSDVDTSLFINHADPDNQMVSEEEDTSVDNESLYFQNFTSSSERLSKLCTIATRITNNEDPKSPLVCTPASDINIPGMQKKSFPEPDRDDAITSLPSSSPLSEQEKSENVEKGKKRRGSIFRRILSSCRRGLSRAARVFTCCCRSPTDI